MKMPFRLWTSLMLIMLVLSAVPVTEAQGGLPVATVACDQYMRSQPDSHSAPVAVLRPDEPLMLITGRDETGGWLVVLRQNGQAGWVARTECIAVQGNISNAPLTAPQVYSGPPIATIGCTNYVHSAPANDAPRLLILYPDDGVLSIIGRDESGGWLLVQRADGEMGWVYDTPCIVVEGDVFDAPVSDVEMPVPGPDGTLPPKPEILPAATVGCTNYVHSAPANDSPRLLILYPEDGVLAIVGRDQSGGWLLVQRADGEMGWVYDTPCIVVEGDVFDAPVTTDITIPLPGEDSDAVDVPLPNVTLACTNYVRSAANNASARLMILYPGDGPLEILARDRVGEWLLVRRADGAMGWVVNTQCIVVHGNVFDAPLDTSVVMPVPGVSEGDLSGLEELLTPGAAPEPTPTVTVPLPNVTLSCANYVRSAADNASARLMILYPGDGPLEILARDRIAEWLLVRRADGAMGWVVNTQCVNVHGNVFDAPLDTSVVMPVPTPAPEEALPFPGATPPPDWPPQS